MHGEIETRRKAKTQISPEQEMPRGLLRGAHAGEVSGRMLAPRTSEIDQGGRDSIISYGSFAVFAAGFTGGSAGDLLGDLLGICWDLLGI